MDYQIDTLIHLDTRLRTRLLHAIIARWQAGERAIASQELYEQLCRAGAHIPAGAMAVVFDNLRDRRLIEGRLPQDSAAMSLHGDTQITWLHPRLLAPPEQR
jgi:hypothetical protein